MPWYEAFDREIRAAAAAAGGAAGGADGPAYHLPHRRGRPAGWRFPKPRRSGPRSWRSPAQWDPLVIGKGSNLLAPDGGLDRLVISTVRLEAVEPQGETALRAAAGISLARLAAAALPPGAWRGWPLPHGIPGTLGGAVFMNAGAYGGEMRQVVRSVRAWYPQRGIVTLGPEELAFDYRRSVFSDGEGVILSALVQLEPGDPAAIRAEMEELAARRRSRQPLEYPSAGSTFKRPEGHFAGVLIEQCGLKGYRVGGGPRCRRKHAGFVVNAGGATCGDVLRLMEHVQKTVLAAAGVWLEPEVRVL